MSSSEIYQEHTELGALVFLINFLQSHSSLLVPLHINVPRELHLLDSMLIMFAGQAAQWLVRLRYSLNV